MPITGTLTRAATADTCASAIARTAGPERPPVPPPSQAAPGRSAAERASAIARSVLMSDTASAPPACAAAAQLATSAVFGVSFTISGLRVRGRRWARTRSSWAGSAPMSRPVRTLGQDTLSSIAAISSRAWQASTSRANSSAVEPITLVISGTGQRPDPVGGPASAPGARVARPVSWGRSARR